MRAIGGALVLGGLLVMLAAIFAFSMIERPASFGDLKGRGHEWLTGSTVKFTRNWFREGARPLRFAMLENPRSIEFPDLRSREPYVSYPVGCLLPVYGVSLLMRREPSPAMVMGVNLAGHFLGALGIFAIVALGLKELGVALVARVVLGLLAFLFYVFLPGPMYWLQNVYFSDQAILPIVVAAWLLEILDQRSSGPGWGIAQSLVVGWGVFTDWLMVPVAAALLLSKMSTRWRGLSPPARIGRSLLFLLPALAAVALFAIQVGGLDGFGSLRGKLLNRTGLAAGTTFHFSQLYERFWKVYLPTNFGGAIAPWLLAISLVVVAVLYLEGRRRGGPVDTGSSSLSRLSLLMIVPPAVHCLVFWQHSVDHSFTPLRFLPAFACVPLVFVPFLVLRRLGLDARDRRVSLAVMVIATNALVFLAGGHRMSGVAREREPANPRLGTSVGQLARYDEVLFSPDFEIPANPPELLAYSMKRVYPLVAPESLSARIASLPSAAQVRLVFLREPELAWQPLLEQARREDAAPLITYRLGAVSDLRHESTREESAPRRP